MNKRIIFKILPSAIVLFFLIEPASSHKRVRYVYESKSIFIHFKKNTPVYVLDQREKAVSIATCKNFENQEAELTILKDDYLAVDSEHDVENNTVTPHSIASEKYVFYRISINNMKNRFYYQNDCFEQDLEYYVKFTKKSMDAFIGPDRKRENFPKAFVTAQELKVTIQPGSDTPLTCRTKDGKQEPLNLKHSQQIEITGRKVVNGKNYLQIQNVYDATEKIIGNLCQSEIKTGWVLYNASEIKLPNIKQYQIVSDRTDETADVYHHADMKNVAFKLKQGQMIRLKNDEFLDIPIQHIDESTYEPCINNIQHCAGMYIYSKNLKLIENSPLRVEQIPLADFISPLDIPYRGTTVDSEFVLDRLDTGILIFSKPDETSPIMCKDKSNKIYNATIDYVEREWAIKIDDKHITNDQTYLKISFEDKYLSGCPLDHLNSNAWIKYDTKKMKIRQIYAQMFEYGSYYDANTLTKLKITSEVTALMNMREGTDRMCADLDGNYNPLTFQAGQELRVKGKRTDGDKTFLIIELYADESLDFANNCLIKEEPEGSYFWLLYDAKKMQLEDVDTYEVITESGKSTVTAFDRGPSYDEMDHSSEFKIPVGTKVIMRSDKIFANNFVEVIYTDDPDFSPRESLIRRENLRHLGKMPLPVEAIHCHGIDGGFDGDGIPEFEEEDILEDQETP